jgi:hypothetical protein
MLDDQERQSMLGEFIRAHASPSATMNIMEDDLPAS